MKIIQLQPSEALKHWPQISELLFKVLEHGQGESTLTDYMQKILNNYAQCWVVVDEQYNIVGAGLTEFMQYKQHKTLHIIAFSGSNFEEQSKVFPTVEQFARDTGCARIEMWGRKGWITQLPKYVPGWKEAYVVMSKDVA
jgi:hypothetical protein